MRFQSAMAAMARNKNHVKQFAERMDWEVDRAEAALLAYAEGKHFPCNDELRAMGVAESLQWAYMVALNAYQVNRLISVPADAEKLYTMIPKATVDRWRLGHVMPSGRNRVKIQNAFPGTDLFFGVPSECVFVYKKETNAIKFDSRRMRLWVNDFEVTLAMVAPNRYTIPHDAIQKGFLEAAKSAGLFFTDCGDFMRAEPAPKVFTYYAKT